MTNCRVKINYICVFKKSPIIHVIACKLVVVFLRVYNKKERISHVPVYSFHLPPFLPCATAVAQPPLTHTNKESERDRTS